MSAKSLVSFGNLQGFRARLAKAVAGLREIQAGEVVTRAAEKVATQVRTVAAKKLSQHTLSGAASGDTIVSTEGGLVQLHGMPACHGAGWERKSYLSAQPWWPFRSGYMPPFIIRNAAQIFEAELAAALRGTRSPLLLADEADEEVAAARAQAKIDRVAAAKQRSEDRRIDNRIKREEGRGERDRLRNTARERRRAEKAVVKSREKYKRDNARIYRQSAEGKAARAAARKKARAS